jgi:hypothetical protein
VERRQASAPEAEGRRKPPSPWRALCAACVQVVDYASAGVPLPFFLFFVGWVERSETHRGVKKDDGFRYRSTHPTDPYPDIAPLIRATGYGPFDIAV